MKGDKELIIDKCNELGFKLVDENFDYDKNRDSKFEVVCLKCGKKSYKTFVTLVKHSCRCRYCTKINRDYKNSLDDVIPLITESCRKNNYTFIGFVGDKWENCRKTKLLLKCNICGKITEKNYDNLINKNAKCICNRVLKAKEKNTLDIEEVNETIKECCNANAIEFISFANKENKYENNRTKLIFRCKECGNVFERAFYCVRYLNTSCEHCIQSSLEKHMRLKLLNENIVFEEQKRFEWLKFKNKLSLDFYLPEYNIGIECQGKQHYEPVKYFGGEKQFFMQKKRDIKKYKLCLSHGIKIIYVGNIEDINELEIKNEEKQK